jgi:hypothetical protein
VADLPGYAVLQHPWDCQHYGWASILEEFHRLAMQSGHRHSTGCQHTHLEVSNVIQLKRIPFKLKLFANFLVHHTNVCKNGNVSSPDNKATAKQEASCTCFENSHSLDVRNKRKW